MVRILKETWGSKGENAHDETQVLEVRKMP